MVPDDPGEPAAIGRKARIGEEVVAGSQRDGRPAGERHRDQTILGLAGAPVVLDDSDHPPPAAVDQGLGEAQGSVVRRADRPAPPIRIEAMAAWSRSSTWTIRPSDAARQAPPNSLQPRAHC
jgi:hypothetical protein